MFISELTTERLVLRPWPAEEAAAVVAGERRPHWAADFPADGERVIAGIIAGNPDRPHGHRLIIERETGLTVGGIGMFLPPTDGAVEFGYGIVESRRCRGYVTEAVRALVADTRTLPGVTRVFATVDPANIASVRVLEKAGLRRDGTVDSDEGLLHRYVAG
ncbi:GNAT family N-acetyltransferase [Micromonospora chaiyaphumensis]|uniref:Protein N-acetyltransferase, RimJ/RimL family n=1 Tax=Micromonospora chaiyaphumensis TaxID=307119 RepID=A0A1C4Z2C2_9ACTN|nr:GNAT family N-acetyltransferase [Micromonospora chaiyaphumensis]SCF27103.1 Protein N-acetyltransferase, RimJ/RimL family [Micromonospora chaiyaphumensis]